MMTLCLQMQKPKHRRSRNKKAAVVAKTVVERRHRPRNERYSGLLCFSRVSVNLGYEAARIGDRITDSVREQVYGLYYAYE